MILNAYMYLQFCKASINTCYPINYLFHWIIILILQKVPLQDCKAWNNNKFLLNEYFNFVLQLKFDCLKKSKTIYINDVRFKIEESGERNWHWLEWRRANESGTKTKR